MERVGLLLACAVGLILGATTGGRVAGAIVWGCVAWLLLGAALLASVAGFVRPAILQLSPQERNIGGLVRAARGSAGWRKALLLSAGYGTASTLLAGALGVGALFGAQLVKMV